MKQMYVQKTKVRRLTNDGVWEVQSSRYPQLWYKVVLDVDANQIYCPCKGFKFGRGHPCRHMFQIMEAEA